MSSTIVCDENGNELGLGGLENELIDSLLKNDVLSYDSTAVGSTNGSPANEEVPKEDPDIKMILEDAMNNMEVIEIIDQALRKYKNSEIPHVRDFGIGVDHILDLVTRVCAERNDNARQREWTEINIFMLKVIRYAIVTVAALSTAVIYMKHFM